MNIFESIISKIFTHNQANAQTSNAAPNSPMAPSAASSPAQQSHAVSASTVDDILSGLAKKNSQTSTGKPQS